MFVLDVKSCWQSIIKYCDQHFCLSVCLCLLACLKFH